MALTPQGRVCFPSVFKASGMEGAERLTFSNVLLFDVDNMSREPNGMNAGNVSNRQLFDDMVEAANAACIKRFGVGLGKEYNGKKLKSPFRRSEESPKHYPPGHIFVNFSSESKPGVVDEARDEIAESSGDYYAGCWAHNSWSVYSFDKGGNRGVAFGLKNTQKTGDDDPFGGDRSTPDDDFEVLEAVDAPVAAASNDDLQF